MQPDPLKQPVKEPTLTDLMLTLRRLETRMLKGFEALGLDVDQIAKRGNQS